MNIKPAAAVVLLLLTGCAASRGVGDATFLETSRRATFGKDIAWQAIDLGAPTPLVGAWDVAAGTYVAVSGERNRAIILAPMPGDDVRVSFDAKLESQHAGGWIGDISVVLGSTTDEKTFFRSGYALTTGSYWNHCTTIYRLGRSLANTEWSPPRPSTWHHVVVEKVGGRMRYLLDGRVVLMALDPQPLAIAGSGRNITLRTWETRLTVRNVAIETPASD